MARISTYEIDTVIHDEDNVVGTDNRAGGRQETRLFPVSALAAHIQAGSARIWPSPADTAEAIQERADAVVEYTADSFPVNVFNAEGELQIAERLPIERYTHGLNTLNVVVKVYQEREEAIDVTVPSDDPFGLGTVVTAYREFTPFRVVIINQNEVLVDYGSTDPFVGFVVILG